MISWLRRRPLHLTDEDISVYIDGEVSVRESERVSTHVAGCDECRARLESVRSLHAMLSALPAPALPRSFVLSPEQAGMRTLSPVPPPAVRWRVPAFAPAVALSLFLVALIVDLSGGATSQSESDAVMNAPVRSSYSAEDAAKSATPSIAPQAAAPAVPSLADSADGAAPDTTRQGPVQVPPPSTGGSSPGGAPASTPRTESANALPPPVPSTTVDALSSSADRATSSSETTSAIPVEPAQGRDADERARDAADRNDGGIEGIRVVEGVLLLLFLVSLFAVAWPRLFHKGAS